MHQFITIAGSLILNGRSPKRPESHRLEDVVKRAMDRKRMILTTAEEEQ
ncbi:MAG: hypothetical protein QF605_05615 [Rhodospirillales bacterium]|jgi:hypothetical protein|nr:hypothetical protein [Rhodospirillales bacterium]